MSQKVGGVEVGCGHQLEGRTTLILCMYKSGIEGFIPVVEWGIIWNDIKTVHVAWQRDYYIIHNDFNSFDCIEI